MRPALSASSKSAPFRQPLAHAGLTSNPSRTSSSGQHEPGAQPRMRNDGRNSAASDGDSVHDQSLPHYLITEVNTLCDQLDQLTWPLTHRLADILTLFGSLKGLEHTLTNLLHQHSGHPKVHSLSEKLSHFIDRFVQALDSIDATTRIDLSELSNEHIQTCCQGLAACAPASAAALWHTRRDKQQVQHLTDRLLQQAITNGLPDAVQANGEVLCILNWASRGLKSGVLMASPTVTELFQKALPLIAAWTSGDQSRQLLSTHNLGRCAVQVTTLINHIGLDWNAKLSSVPSNQETLGDLLQRCILNLCSEAVLKRLMGAPIDAVPLLNVCNLVKDALAKHRLSAHNPSLLPSLASLVSAVGKIPHQALISAHSDCRILSNLANFVRTLCEYRSGREVVIAHALPGLTAACDHLIACINSEEFLDAMPGDQALSNLISFIKLCDKHLERPGTAPASTASPATTTRVSTDPGIPAASRSQLIMAAQRLVEGLTARGTSHTASVKAEALSGLLAGLAYLWQRNLVPRSPELQAYVSRLLAQTSQLPLAAWQDKSRAVLMPTLLSMFSSGLTSETAVQGLLATLLPARTPGQPIILDDLRAAMKQLGAVEEMIDPLPPLPICVTSPAPTSAPAGPRIIPGLTPIRSTPVSGGLSTSPLGMPSSSNIPGSVTAAKADMPDWQEARHVARAQGDKAQLSHTLPAVIPNGLRRKKGPPPKTTPEKNGAIFTPVSNDKEKTDPNKKNGKTTGAPNEKNKPAPASKPAQTLEAAILAGDSSQVDKLMKQGPAWTSERISQILGAVQADMPFYEDDLIGALDRFLTAAVGQLSIVERCSLIAKLAGPKAPALEKLLNRHRLIRLPDNDRSPLKKDKLGATPLVRAVVSKDKAMIAQLLAHSSAPEQAEMTFDTDMNTLMFITKRNDVETAAALLTLPNADAQMAARSSTGLTALMYAAAHGSLEFVRVLLASRPAGDMQTVATGPTGANALMVAAGAGKDAIVAELLAYESTVETQLRTMLATGPNALMMAMLGRHESTVRLLLEHRLVEVQIKGCSDPQLSAPEYAAWNGLAGPLQILLDHPVACAYVTQIMQAGTDLLAIAAANNHLEVFNLLLAHPVAKRLRAGNSQACLKALYQAGHGGHGSIINALRTWLYDANQREEYMEIWWAAVKGAYAKDHPIVLKSLLAYQPAGQEEAIRLLFPIFDAIRSAQKRKEQ